MTSSAVEPHREPGVPRAGGRWSAVRYALLHTFGGWAFLAGVVLKAIYLAARLAVGAESVLVSATGTLGSVALIVTAICRVVRLVPRARRNMLWRVRAQLILSYVFIGVIPALLIVAFFAVSGLVRLPQCRVVPGDERLRQRQERSDLRRAPDRDRDPARPGAGRGTGHPLPARVGTGGRSTPARRWPSCRPRAGSRAWAVRQRP